MAEIRSALEIALEKADRLGKASKEEINADKWLDEGKRTAARYLDQEGEQDLRELVSQAPPEGLTQVLKGASEVLLRNVVLPRDRDQVQVIKKALSGLVAIKGSTARQVASRIEELVEGYLQTRDHYYQQIKAQMQSRIGGVQQALAQQYGMGLPGELDLESMPEFQQEWANLTSQLREQFEEQLAPLKRYLEQL